MPPTSEETQRIHGQYRALTGLDVPYTMKAYFLWSAYLARGLGEPDLACMVRYIKGKIHKGPRTKESLLLENMIQDLDTFQSYLSIARAEARNTRTETPKSRVLAQAGMAKEPKDNCAPVNQILERAKLAEMLGKWRAENL